MDDAERERVQKLFESEVMAALGRSGLQLDHARRLGEFVDAVLALPAQFGYRSAREVFGALGLAMGFAMEVHLEAYPRERRVSDAQLRELLSRMTLDDVEHLISLWALRLLKEDLLREP